MLPEGSEWAASPVAGPVVESDELLVLRNVSKTFPGTQALSGVDFEVRAGEIHALVGQNGSGKSTLVKILAGVHGADAGGEGWIDGESLDLESPIVGKHDRLRFVHQDLGLVLELSTAENLALFRGFQRGRFGRLRWGEQAAVTRTVLARFGVDIDIDAPLSAATPVERTIVAIACALQGWDEDRGVLVMDEPTAVLSPREVTRLFEIIAEVRTVGTSVLYISHRLDEIFQIADRVSVIRGGRMVATRDVSETTPHELASLMVGEHVDPDLRTAVPVSRSSPVALEARDVHGRALRGVDVELRRGEVLGLAGLQGSGHQELVYALAGHSEGTVTGELRIPGERGDRWFPMSEAAALGLPLVPADRAAEGVVADFSVRENLSLSLLSKLSERFTVSRREERGVVDDWIGRLQIRTDGRDAAITTLSGGNQQKVVMARCLAQDPHVLLLCEPTAGVDIGTRVALYAFIAELARKGLSVVVSDSDIDELVAIASRVLVFGGGRVVQELDYDHVTHSALVHAIEGITTP
jgi:ABC-type sugar transport system ATPase subunit